MELNSHLVTSFPPFLPFAPDDLRAAALFYASCGFRVLPLHSPNPAGYCSCGRVDCQEQGLHPRFKEAIEEATSNPAHIQLWWELYPDANIGIATGSSLLVVTIDALQGASLEQLQRFTSLPPTAKVLAGYNCWHLYYRYDPLLPLENTVGRLLKGVNTYAQHGYVVAPPSRTASGARYEWADWRELTHASTLLVAPLVSMRQVAENLVVKLPVPLPPPTQEDTYVYEYEDAEENDDDDDDDYNEEDDDDDDDDNQEAEDDDDYAEETKNYDDDGYAEETVNTDASSQQASNHDAAANPPATHGTDHPEENDRDDPSDADHDDQDAGAQGHQPAHPCSAPKSNSTRKQSAQPTKRRVITHKQRYLSIVSLTRALHHHGADTPVLLPIIRFFNKAYCRPMLTESELKRIAQAARQWEKKPSPLIALAPLKDLMSEQLPEPQWAIPDLLPEGVTLLAGKPKMGKSWLALGLALAVANGGLALDKLPTQTGQVLYLGLEDSRRRTQQRVRRLLQGQPIPRNFVWGGTWPQLQPDGLHNLETWLANAQSPRLIVIDTLARVRAPSNGGYGVYGDDYAVITPLKELADRHHVSILVIHHLRKTGANDPMDEISGSTGLTGATDCNMVLQRERGESLATLHISGRDLDEQQLRLKFTDESALWSLAYPRGETSPLHASEKVLAFLQKTMAPCTPQEIAAALGMDASHVRRQLRRLKYQDLIKTPTWGYYRANSESF